MIRSTGLANAKHLRSLVFGSKQDKLDREQTQRQRLASLRWAAAAQCALAVSLTSSQNDLRRVDIEDKSNILEKTKDAVITLQGVLEGKHDKVIHATLHHQHQVSKDSWWSALCRVVEGIHLYIFKFIQYINYNNQYKDPFRIPFLPSTAFGMVFYGIWKILTRALL